MDTTLILAVLAVCLAVLAVCLAVPPFLRWIQSARRSAILVAVAIAAASVWAVEHLAEGRSRRDRPASR